jgi:hypothetical protein
VRGPRLGGLGAHLVRLRAQRVDLLLRVGALPLPAALVQLALVQVGLPVDVVDVKHGPVRIQVVDLVDATVQQVDVVADDDQATVVGTQEVAQPPDRVGVQVVRRLVQQQGGVGARGAGEQDAGELDAAALPAGQRAQRLAEHPVRQAECGGDPGRLRLGRVAAEDAEPLLQPAVTANRRVPGALVDELRHLKLELLHLPQQAVQATGGQHPVPGGVGKITAARVLRQVADLAAEVDLTGERQRLPGEHPQQRRLAGAVAPDQADPVPRLDTEGHRFDQGAGAGAQLQLGRNDHYCGGLSDVSGWGGGWEPVRLGRSVADRSGRVSATWEVGAAEGMTSRLRGAPRVPRRRSTLPVSRSAPSRPHPRTRPPHRARPMRS